MPKKAPMLLASVAAFVKKQKHGALGWFDSFGPEKMPKEWDPKNATRLDRAGLAFMSLPEGSVLALLETKQGPDAVVLLGSEGDRRTVAGSLEEFLVLWSKAETEISELDDEEAVAGRKLLAKWIASKKLKTPKTKPFDFQAWLDGAPAAKPEPAPELKRAPTATMKKLGPKAQELASLIGLRADDPKVIDYVAKLGKKLPQSTSDRNDDAGIDASKKFGVQLSATHDVLNDASPPIKKTAQSFVPWVSTAWVDEKFGEAILGVPWNASRAEVEKLLGKPMKMRGFLADDEEKTVAVWTYALDEGAHVELEITFRNRVEVLIGVATAADLEKYDRVEAGVFLAWALTRGLLDEERLAKHAALIAAMKKKQATGGELWDVLARGLWDDHLKDDGDLRNYAYGYFHNIGGDWITADLKKVFGKRKGPYGHDEPKLDDPTWDAVGKATKILDQRFSRWIGKR
jgi:hypothetical protein